MIKNRELFIEESIKTLNGILDELKAIPNLNLKELDANKTVLCIVDMVNGFAKKGALSDPRINKLINVIVEMVKECKKLGISVISIEEGHDEGCSEFDAFPEHCLKDSWEGELVDEIKELGTDHVFKKNSTNGFIEDDFKKWLDEKVHLDNFIVVGDCTDICIQQFATSLKSYFNKVNKCKRIIIPKNAVDTYHFGLHNGDLMNIMSLFSMKNTGIEITKYLQEKR